MAGRTSAATERALRRVMAGEKVAPAARAEGINASTLFRAIASGKDKDTVTRGRIVIVGAGALGRELKQWLVRDERDEPIVFVDDFHKGPSVLCDVKDYARAEGDEVLVAIADCRQRSEVADRFASLASFTASSALKGECEIGPGALLFPRAIVSTNVHVGTGFIANCFSSIGHDCRIGDFVTLSSHVDITGRCIIGNRVFLGSGARVLPGVTIGDDVFIGAGAVVLRDLPAGAKVYGNPAKAIA